MYINQLSKHCQNFKEVYLIWDNHHEKDKDKDYLYEEEPEIPISDEFYNFLLSKYHEIDEEKGKVKVLVSIFGRETPVELDFLQIQKV